MIALMNERIKSGNVLENNHNRNKYETAREQHNQHNIVHINHVHCFILFYKKFTVALFMLKVFI